MFLPPFRENTPFPSPDLPAAPEMRNLPARGRLRRTNGAETRRFLRFPDEMRNSVVNGLAEESSYCQGRWYGATLLKPKEEPVMKKVLLTALLGLASLAVWTPSASARTFGLFPWGLHCCGCRNKCSFCVRPYN